MIGTITKKCLSGILALAMVISLLPTLTIFASAATWNGSDISTSLSGGGISGNPYLIASGADLAFLAQQVTAANTTYNSAFYELTADIDLGSKQWTPIGTTSSNSFLGNFNGNGHVVC